MKKEIKTLCVFIFISALYPVLIINVESQETVYFVPEYEIKNMNFVEDNNELQEIENIVLQKKPDEWLPETEIIPLCEENHSVFKSFMDYKTITDQTSTQYQLIYSDEIILGDDGFLYSDEYIGVALGSRFGKVGDKFIITLDTGKQFKVIKLDEKADVDTVSNCHHRSDGSIIEFVISIRLVNEIYPNAIKLGDFNCIEQFNGLVIKIEKIVQ